MEMVVDFLKTLALTGRDLVPIVLLFGFFQMVIIKKPLDNLPRIAVGSIYVLIGLTLFLVGLQDALFPLGKLMAAQLTDAEFLKDAADLADWKIYGWIYAFAAAIGFATTVAEPSLIAVAYKAADVSGGSISQWGLRITVAIGVAFGISLGTFRIVTGTPLHLYIMAGYVVVIIQTFFAPKSIIPLAYDSGGVTTSTVTVPIVAALGLGLSAAVPGRNPAIDGFGLIAFASLFPIITVLGYAQIAEYRGMRKVKAREEKRNAL
ncbi:DUF1538 domain-containing protein [Desulfopila sp. IMCC35008]|uniref:DUF1538 domain-containing protein n=1 Tax=Desulfopila sp. IMCC35008 TaxID=2653858 RepID=UPI0013D27BA9|nr:DUF1538 domain-containing protein [Desulfopila sp. IMCC35008]